MNLQVDEALIIRVDVSPYVAALFCLKDIEQ